MILNFQNRQGLIAKYPAHIPVILPGIADFYCGNQQY